MSEAEASALLAWIAVLSTSSTLEDDADEDEG